MPNSTHEISLRGLSGGIFWCVFSALIFYVSGFATAGWEYIGAYRKSAYIGLWATCTSENPIYGDQAWFRAVQAMITIGLILLIVGVIAIILYMFLHSASVSKNTLLITFAVVNFAAVVFMVIGFIIFGSNHQHNLNVSFAFCAIGAILCCGAGIISVVQMKKSNVF